MGWPGREATAQKVGLIVDPEATASWELWALEVQEQPVGWIPKDLSSQHGGVDQESGGQAWGSPTTSQYQEFLLLRQV